ncbi:MAG: oligosaccharide flippase family protein [Flavobacteriia bacterium]|nr:oligosaccharide flippase family protein [Flavobacteriia bacterium]
MNNRVSKNIGYLGLSQAANYVLPLVTLPYITRVVGPENYGSIEFATVTMLYFSAIVMYGFTFTATRRIAELGDNFKRISSVYSSVMQAKILLLVVSALLFILLIFAIPTFGDQLTAMLYAFPIVIGWAMYPDFLFQGREKLGVIAMVNLGIKVLGAALIFILLRRPDQYYYVLGINAGAQLLAGIATIIYAHRIYPSLKFSLQPLKLVLGYLKSGFYIFASHFMTRVYTFGTILFLGFLLSDVELGLFAAAMKLIVVGQSFLFTPVGGALYPHLARTAGSDLNQYVSERAKFQWGMLGLTALAGLVIFLFPSFFVELLFGEDYLSVAPILQWMSPVLMLTTLSHFAMKQGLMIIKADVQNLYVVLLAGIASIALNYTLIEFHGILGAAWAKLAVEALLAISAILFFRKALSRKLAENR